MAIVQLLLSPVHQRVWFLTRLFWENLFGFQFPTMFRCWFKVYVKACFQYIYIFFFQVCKLWTLPADMCATSNCGFINSLCNLCSRNRKLWHYQAHTVLCQGGSTLTVAYNKYFCSAPGLEQHWSILSVPYFCSWCLRKFKMYFLKFYIAQCILMGL